MTAFRPEDLVTCDPADRSALERLLKSHNISLTTDEFSRVCNLLGRQPTVVELHIFNTMWSEHCSYKSSRTVLGEYLPTEGPNVVLGPGEDAGIIRFAEIGGRSWCVAMAHESHNHPSQVLPVEGAATGIGGIVRDVYCMGADVIGVLDPLRFGDPTGPNSARVRDIVWGVVDGIAQYGNALGVPNYGGDTYFDASYDDNCLVNVVAIGVVEEDKIIRSRVPKEARDEPYSMVLIGKPTDASGFGGATFASERLSEEEAVERQGAVQEPDPFLKRVLVEAIKEMLRWADQNGIAIGFKDLGAGGIACASSEMAEAAGLGVSIDLDRVNCAFSDMRPEVISCSETQERFMLAVPTRLVENVLEIFNEFFELPKLYTGAGAFVIGEVTTDKRFKIAHGGRLVSDADVEAITTGILYEREAKEQKCVLTTLGLEHAGGVDGTRDVFLKLLSSYNIATKDSIYQHYDSEVQGRAVIRPGEADAAVGVLLPGEKPGMAAGIGGSSRLASVNPYLGGVWSVVEAVRNVVCVGATPLAITDCLNFGDPEDPGVFYQFSSAVRGIGDACRALRLSGDDNDKGVPVVSGNVSFYNQSETGDAIAPTPIVACVGRIDDAAAARNMAFKKAGSTVILLGNLHDRLGGSEFDRYFGKVASEETPEPDFVSEVAMLRVLLEGFRDGTVLAAHDISHGGVLVALAEMVLGSRPFDVGCELDFTPLTGGREKDSDALLFGEYGGIVVEVPADGWTRFEASLGKYGAPFHKLGKTRESGGLRIETGFGVFELGVDQLDGAFKGGIAELLG
jgi:phosphoribosylformylglycinamidine synthase II